MKKLNSKKLLSEVNFTKNDKIKTILKDLFLSSFFVFVFSFYLKTINPEYSLFSKTYYTSLFFSYLIFFLLLSKSKKTPRSTFIFIPTVGISLIILAINLFPNIRGNNILTEIIFLFSIFLLIIFTKIITLKNLKEKITSKKLDIAIGILFLIFIIIQIIQIFNSGIGTDEGNSLYTAKLLLENKFALYKDFWAREPVAIFFLIPYLKIFGISIVKLRFFVLIINTLALLVLFLIAKKYFNKLSQILILFFSILIINNTFNIYAGIFYQFWTLLSIFLIFLILKFSEKQSPKMLFFIALTTGISILCYKGFMIFWIIIPACLFFILNKNLKKTLSKSLLFLVSSLLPILAFYFYYSLKTDFYHIYKIILHDVFLKAFSILILILLAKFLTQSIKIQNYFKKNKPNNLIFYLLFSSIIISIFFFVKNPDSASIFWGGFVNEAFYFIITFLTIFILIKNRYRRLLALLTSTFMLFLLNFFGFGDSGFISDLEPKELNILTFFQILLIIYLFIVSRQKNNLLIEDKKTKIILVSASFLYLGFFFGGYQMSARVLMILPIYPLFFIFILNLLAKNKLNSFVLFSFTILNLLFLLATNYLFLLKNNSYKIYDIKDFQTSINYLKENASEKDFVFSGDTALLSEIKAENSLSLTSPWNFRDKQNPAYLYEEMNSNYDNMANQNKEHLLIQMNNNKPKYIFGSGRLTFVTFFNNDESIKLKEFLENNYDKAEEFGSIKIYELKN